MSRDPGLAKFEWIYPNNWTEKYDYTCDKARLREIAKTCNLVINTIFCTLMLYLTDIMGRKKVILITALVTLAGLAMNLFIPNLFIKMLGLGFAGGSEGVIGFIFPMMMREITRKQP